MLTNVTQRGSSHATLLSMIVAVDTGASKTLVAVFNDNGEIQEKQRYATPSTTTEYTELLRQLLAGWYKQYEITETVIALPGIVKDEVALWCNNLGWKDFAVKKVVQDLTTTPIYVENDANLGGFGEVKRLSDMPELALYITLSTGIGTGVITRGIIDPAFSQSEGGKMRLEFNGERQEWEKFASGKAIAEHFGKYAQDINDEHQWQDIALRISRGLEVIIPLLQPDHIIVGGSIGTYFDRFSSQLQAILQATIPAHLPLPVIRQAVHPEEAVIYGCYFYALDQHPH